MARIFTDYARVSAIESRLDILENIVIMGNWEGTSIMVEIQRLQGVTDGLVVAIDNAMTLLTNLRGAVESGGATQVEIDAVTAQLEAKKLELIEATTPSDTGGSMGGQATLDPNEAADKAAVEAAAAVAQVKAETTGASQS